MDTQKIGIYPPQTLWKRIQLLFKPKLYTFDEDEHVICTITYKVLNGVFYVLQEEVRSKE